MTSYLAPDAMRARRFKTARTVLALMLREMSTTYGRSPGGYLWAVLEPVGAIAVLSFGFSLLVRNPALGTSFILFFATGFLPFGMYNVLANTIARSLRFSRALLAYPGVTPVDAILARFFLNALTQMMVFYLVIAGILILFATRTILDFPPILLSLLMSALLGLAVGTMNCVLLGLFPIWEQIWSIVTRPLFLASGILFLLEDLPPLAQSILWFNPLVHITGIMRTGFYSTYDAAYASPVYVFALSAVLMFFGLLLLRRYDRIILNQ